MNKNIKCPYCSSEEILSKAVRKNTSGSSSQRYQCRKCNKWFSSIIKEEPIECERPTKWVITSCQNNVPVNVDFIESLNNYCVKNSAKLLIIPILYRPDDFVTVQYNIPEHIPHTLVRNKLGIHNEVYVMGQFNFIPTTVNPLQGLESLSKGDTLIVPSPQLRMKSLGVSASRHPAILHTTGAISYPEYASSKVGEKAKFNHTFAAVLVEVDSDNDFHIRVLNADTDGVFIDLGIVYRPVMRLGEFVNPEALVTGDEHAIVADPEVEKATYTSENSIVRTLKPKYVVRHDVLDCLSINHHTRKNLINKIAKNLLNKNNLEDELILTCEYIIRTSEYFTGNNIIISSNHIDHIIEWLNNINIKDEPWNAKIYFWLMYKLIDSLEKTETGFKHISPFEFYCLEYGVKNIRFISRDENFNIAGIELSHHGDKGINGSRGNLSQFSNILGKTVIAHSHTSGIIGEAYQVGTSSYKKLDYNIGISSWSHTHCLVYPNGKRQLINIINGKWHA